MADPLTTTFIAVACAVWPLDAFLLLRGLRARLRRRRLHRWARNQVRAVLPCPDTAGLPGPRHLATAGVAAVRPVTSAVSNGERGPES